jgi:gluconokinase
MPAALIDSQFATLEVLEPDELGATLDVAQPVDTLVDESLGLLTSPSSYASALPSTRNPLERRDPA